MNDTAQAATPTERPRPVRIALALLWLYIALYALLLASDLAGGASATLAWLVPIVTVAIVAALTAFVAKGSNAARWSYAVLFVLGSLPLAIDPSSVFARSALIGGLNLAMFALQLIALVLLFQRASNAWFAAAR